MKEREWKERGDWQEKKRENTQEKDPRTVEQNSQGRVGMEYRKKYMRRYKRKV